MKKIDIIFVGEMHQDPAPSAVIQSLLEQFKAQALMCHFGSEVDGSWTLAFKTQMDEVCVQLAKSDLADKDIQALQSHDPNLLKPYFKMSVQESIQRIFSAKLGGGADKLQEAVAMASRVVRHNNFLMEHQLDQYLNEASIPFYGTECTGEQYQQMIDLALINVESMVAETEDQRTTVCLDTILEQSIKHNEHDHLVVVHLSGALHAHRLAASMQLRLEKLGTADRYDIQLHPLLCFSDYVGEIKEVMLHQIEADKSRDTPELQAVYPSLPLQVVTPEECHNGRFKSAALNELANKIILRGKKANFYIDNNAYSKEKVDSLGGQVQSQEAGGKFVQFFSADLNRAARTPLGLMRTLGTLPRATRSHQLEAFNADPRITVEPTTDKAKFMITYPNDCQEKVSQIVLHFANYQAERVPSMTP